MNNSNQPAYLVVLINQRSQSGALLLHMADTFQNIDHLDDEKLATTVPALKAPSIC